jgi:hypothetical protein
MKGIRYLGILLGFAVGIWLAWLLWPPRVLVTWETASEVDTVGFYLYRADSPEGPFVLLDETPVPATGDPLTGASYQFEDRRVIWGREYFYQLEELERDGGRHRYPEVVRARAGPGWGWAVLAGILVAGGVWKWSGRWKSAELR